MRLTNLTVWAALAVVGACAATPQDTGVAEDTGVAAGPGVATVRAADITVRDVTRQTRGGQVNDTKRCERTGRRVTEVVRVRFDVLPSGRTAEPEVVDSTNACYDRYARTTVLGWRYRPPVLDGAPVRITGMTARVTFQRRSGV